MKYLFAVSGSIAAYKAYDAVRDLIKLNHQVKVILTKGALEFIKPETFRYLGAEAVYSAEDDFKTHQKEEGETSQILHINLRNWCDKIIIYPLSANTAAHIAQGMAKDLLQSVLLANIKPVMIFPAMNTAMYNHPLTRKNFEILKSLPQYYVHPTIQGILACGDEGEGKLALPAEAVELIETWYGKAKEVKNILITTGATQAPIDPVRYLTNPASGKTGYFIAKEFLKQGHKVQVISGILAADLFVNLNAHPNFKLHIIRTTNEMKAIALDEFANCDTYISAAAICDLEFQTTQSKLKKENLEGVLHYENAVDILAAALEQKSDQQRIIGFAAETQINEKMLNKKWQRKPVDLLIGNPIDNGIESNIEQGFGTDHGEYWFFSEGKLHQKASLSKSQLAQQIHQWTIQ